MSIPIPLICGRDPTEEISGGHSSYVRAHARAAILAGFEPHLFCIGATEKRFETEFGSIHRERAAFTSSRQWGIPWHGPRIARQVLRFLRREGAPAVVHGFGLWGWAGILVARGARDQGVAIRTIVNAYTSHPEEASSLVRGLDRDRAKRSLAMSYRAQEMWSRVVLTRLERRVLRESTSVIVNYDAVRRLIERRYGVLPHCRKLPYCPETAMRDSACPQGPPATQGFPRSADPSLIVAIARHDPRKGIATLLDALRLLRGTGVDFRAKLIGDGPLLATHRGMVAKFGLNRFVEITGPVTDAFAELRKADVFVLPSLEEQSGSLALLEALQAGVPAVASAVDGICEDVEDEKSALLVPPRDAAALSAALARMLADRRLRRNIALEGREVYRRRFSAAGLADALRELYS